MRRIINHLPKLETLFFVVLTLLGMGMMDWANAAPAMKDTGSIPSNWLAGGGG